MPPNPNVSAEFKQHLSSEQAVSVEQAVQQGKPVNTQEMALRNILSTHENPEDALQDLASGRATMEARWNILDQNKQAGGGLMQVDREEYDRLEKQIKGNQQLEASIPRAYRQVHADQITDYRQKPLEELSADVSGLAMKQTQAEDAVREARRTNGSASQEYRDAVAGRNRARGLRQEAEQIYNERNQPNVEAAAKTAAEQGKAERDAEESRLKQQRAELEGLDVGDLRGEITRLGSQETDLQVKRVDRVAAGAGAKEIAEIDQDIIRTQERNGEADRILGDKLTRATEDIDKGVAKTAEESFAERATSTQLLDEIAIRQGTADQLRVNVELLRDQLDNPALTAAQRRDLQNQLYDTTQNLQREEVVLKLYQGEISKSNKEFRAMDADGRAEQLVKLADELDISHYNREDINARLLAGENVTKEELAAWSKLTVGELAQHGRGNFNMGELNRILASKPELRVAVASGIANDARSREFLRQNFPNNWEKVLDFAKKNPGLLMLLLAILAGTAGVAALAVGPGLGVAAGAAGIGAGGFGATRPRNYR